MKFEKRKTTQILLLHYIKLLYRSILFVLAVVIYVMSIVGNSDDVIQGLEKEHWLLLIIWLVYVVEMVCRFFPSKLESMGCQKQFKRNYNPTEKNNPKLQSWKRTLAVTVTWLLLNGIIGILYYTNIIDKSMLVLISLAYGVCDMICILFFCPFQTWFMKNRCCSDCRIYNWDYAMMFTPYIFIPSIYTWSLLALSLLLLIRWEVAIHRHPERFSKETNASLSCENCKEKLCHQKKQLLSLWKKIKNKE